MTSTKIVTSGGYILTAEKRPSTTELTIEDSIGHGETSTMLIRPGGERSMLSKIGEALTGQDPLGWEDAFVEVHYNWTRFTSATTELERARFLTDLNNAMSDLQSWHPENDDHGTMAWEREDEDFNNPDS